MIKRSPNICVNNFTYGVSPQPEHAPEYSNNGSMNCVDFTSGTSDVRGGFGSWRKNLKLTLSCSCNGAIGTMFNALFFGSALDFTGQISKHNVHPVQSSGAPCNEYFAPLCSLDRKSTDLNVCGASVSWAGLYHFARIAACGQMSTHLLHWMQMD